MKIYYKTILGVAGFIAFLLALVGFQSAFLNGFASANLILILLLFLIIRQNTFLAILTAGIGGMLIDTFHFSVFGATPLVFLILTLPNIPKSLGFYLEYVWYHANQKTGLVTGFVYFRNFFRNFYYIKWFVAFSSILNWCDIRRVCFQNNAV